MARKMYVVKVSDKRTGKASTIDVEAEGPVEAGRIAADQGWFVNGVEEVGAPKPGRNPPPSTSEDLGEIIEKLNILNERVGRMLDRWPSPDQIRSAVTWGVVVALLVVALVSMFVTCVMRTA